LKIPFKNIAISGGSGTGKTTLSNNLSEKLGWKHLNNGAFVRQWYEEKGLDLNQVREIPEEVDRQIDESFKEKMSKESGAIFESRLAGWQARGLKDVFKVLCTTDYKEALRRVSARDGSSLEDAEKTIETREAGLAKKFKQYYGVSDYLDPKYFDLVVDTTTLTPEEVLEVVVKKLSNERSI
jgi:predicted cytidylate kinase